MPGTFLNNDPKIAVKEQFQKITTIGELASLLNYIERKFTPNDPKINSLSSRDLNYLAQTKDNRYFEFTVKKKNRNNRQINAPDEYLKRVQQLLNILLQIIFEDKVHFNTNGFLYNRNIVRNAKPHIGKRFLLNIDIQDYFPTINFRRIKTVLGLSPFDCIGDKEFIGFIIANLCVQNGKLPQGAPTSPIISNIVTQRLDRKISKLCHSQKIKYSRYADDLTFSANKNHFSDGFLKQVENILNEEGFVINTEKTRIKTLRDRQEVTGIIVNQKLNVNRKFIKKTRTILHNWEKSGAEYAQKVFNANYAEKEKGFPDFRRVLSGYIHFIGLVRGKNDELFNNLLLKFGYLNYQIDYDFITHSGVKRKLIKDNKRMEMILLDKVHSPDDKFISFCTAAFHQIENLINYFYWRRFPVTADLLQFLYNNNDELKKKWKKQIPNFDKISKLNISILIYAFEKEFYFDKGISYNKDLTLLREARNDDSHRCQVVNYDISAIKADYQRIRDLNKAYYEQNKKFRPLTKTEEQTRVKYKVIRLLEDKNYNRVRNILNKVVNQIKDFQY
jgi:RNA-directed DNA polymerase